MMAQSQFEWLYFDLDNTILDFNASSKAAFFLVFEDLNITLSEADYTAYLKINKSVWAKFEEGAITVDELKVKRWADFLALKKLKDLDPINLNEAYFERIKTTPIFIPGAEEVLKKLKPFYPNMAIITNGLTEVQRPRLKLSGLDTIFNPIVISDEIGHAKPNKAFFDHIHRLTGYPEPEKVLVIGDTLSSDIKGGKDFGFKTCWHDYYQDEDSKDFQPDFTIQKIADLSLLLLGD